MYTQTPDFYLGSSEHRDDWARPRACKVLGNLTTEDERDSILVNVDPPVIGQAFGLGGEDIIEVVLAIRHKGASFPKTITNPVPVLIYRILNPDAVKSGGKITSADLKLSAWGEIYQTSEAAERAAKK